MTALLEFKQRLKGFYGRFEAIFQPIVKFVVALLYFMWINANMGYMSLLDNIFVILILALVCCLLPSGITTYAGCALMVAHAYALSMEVAAFLLVLILFMLILFLRFSSGKNVVMAITPLAFAFDLPVLLPIGGGLLSSATAAFPAGCGVILYYFIRLIRSNAEVLANVDVDIMEKITILADGIAQNWGMWLTVAAVVIVLVLVNIIRTRSFDYAWRIAIVIGGIAYVLIMYVGGLYVGVQLNMMSLIVYAVVSVVVGVILEFFVFGGDYTRTEHLSYEDDEYYYYVKAVPKASVTTSERNIKKINAEPVKEKEERKAEVKAAKAAAKSAAKANAKPAAKPVKTSAKPASYGAGVDDDIKIAQPKQKSAGPAVKKVSMEDVDFEKKLEESLRDL